MLTAFEMEEWPETSKFQSSTEFKIELEKLAEDCPRSLLFNFREINDGEVIKALESPACEFVRAIPHFILFKHQSRLKMCFARLTPCVSWVTPLALAGWPPEGTR